MKRAFETVFAIAIITVEVASVGLAATSVSAQDSTSQKIAHQQRLLLQQRRQLEQNQRALDTQRRQLARRGAAVPAVPAVQHGLWGDCPLGFTYYLLQGCLPDHAVIVYNGGRIPN